MATMMEVAQAVTDGNDVSVRALVNQLLAEGNKPAAIIEQGLLGGMAIVGPLFRDGEMFVPEVLVSVRAMKAGLEIVKPMISDTDMQKAGKIVIGSVKGDLHDIGKNLVAMMMESNGFEVVDLGIDISPETFIQAIKDEKPDIVALSALLTTTRPALDETIKAFVAAGVRESCKVIVGGAPIDQAYADKIGADGYAPDGSSAAELCKQLMTA